MEFRNNTWTCKECGSPMSGDFSSHDLPHAHCLNPHCQQFNRKHLLPREPHRPASEHHVKPREPQPEPKLIEEVPE